jgi:hypothetical protein
VMPRSVARVGCTRYEGGRLRAVRVHASTTPYATSYLRFGTSTLTYESDVELALRAIRDL